MLDPISQACIDVLNQTNGLTVKQMIHSIESHFPSVDLSPNPSILVAARINSYIRRLELGQLELESTFVQKKLSDNHPKRMIYTIIDRPEPAEIERERKEREKEKERKRQRSERSSERPERADRDSKRARSDSSRRDSDAASSASSASEPSSPAATAFSQIVNEPSPVYMASSPQRLSFHRDSDDDLSDIDDSDDEEHGVEVTSTAATTPTAEAIDHDMDLKTPRTHTRGLDQTLAPAKDDLSAQTDIFTADLSLDITKLFNPYYDTVKEAPISPPDALGWVNDEEDVGCPEQLSLGDLEEMFQVR